MKRIDHIQSQHGKIQHHHSFHSLSMDDDIEKDGANPRHTSTPRTLSTSHESSSMGAPSHELHESSRDLHINDDDCHEGDSPLHYNTMLNDDNQSVQSNVSGVSLSSPRAINKNIEKEEHSIEHESIGQNQIPSLSQSTYSGYDTEEDEDGVLKRFHDQAKSSMEMNLSLQSDDDSVYSAINTIDINDASNDHSCSSHGGQRKKKKRHSDRIKDAIHGMRKAHNDAQRQRSTRQFLALSEGNRTAHSFTEMICLSPWCDFSYGRGMALMMGALFILVAVVIALIKLEYLAGGIWTFILGVAIILLRRFWVPIYWLVYGQYVEKRQRKNMQRYDTLIGERSASLKMSVQNSFEQVQGHDESEIELTDELVYYDEVNSNRTPEELV